MADPFHVERGAIDRRLDEICESCSRGLAPTLSQAISYGLKSPGKRLRPLLLILGYRACGGGGDATLLACAPEIIHSYSLMHDDLPCMDDDEYRRGRPTAHMVYGTHTTITAGVTMIPLAVKVACDASHQMKLPGSVTSALAHELLGAAGSAGMIGGQLRDLAGEGKSLSIEERETIHLAKTAALITASLRMGGLAALASPDALDAISTFGGAIGLAFQIMDDVLDVTSTSTVLGKTAGKDEALRKSTYPDLLGVEGARERALALISGGIGSLAKGGLLTQELSQVANFMVNRTS
ncbi:MAG: polyprenyl synthetase family protein [Gemmatimonadaceae bacterium]